MSQETPQGNFEDQERVKEQKRNELLDQGKGWEAIQYALQEGLPMGDDELFDALDAVREALERAESDEEKERLSEENMKILRWRFPDQSDEELREIN